MKQLRIHRLSSSWLSLLMIVLVGIWVGPFSSTANADTLHAQDDTHIDLVKNDANFGNKQDLILKYINDGSKKSGATQVYVRFSLNSLPNFIDATNIEKAVLRIWVSEVRSSGEAELHLINAGWDEYLLTALNAPPTSFLGTLDFTDDDNGQYVTLDVTGVVRDWVNLPSTNFGLAMIPSTSGPLFIRMDSKENRKTGHGMEIEVALIDVGPEGPQGIAGNLVLAGQNCADGESVTGFDPAGNIICSGSSGSSGCPGMICDVPINPGP